MSAIIRQGACISVHTISQHIPPQAASYNWSSREPRLHATTMRAQAQQLRRPVMMMAPIHIAHSGLDERGAPRMKRATRIAAEQSAARGPANASANSTTIPPMSLSDLRSESSDIRSAAREPPTQITHGQIKASPKPTKSPMASVQSS
eukprot:7389585-Prymnesium_polylepis.1